MIHRHVIQIGSRFSGCLVSTPYLAACCLSVYLSRAYHYNCTVQHTLRMHYAQVCPVLVAGYHRDHRQSSGKSRNHKYIAEYLSAYLHWLGTVFRKNCILQSYIMQAPSVDILLRIASTPCLYRVRTLWLYRIQGLFRYVVYAAYSEKMEYAWLPSTGISRMESSGRRICMWQVAVSEVSWYVGLE